MGISPTYKTATPIAPLWQISLVPDSGTFDITGLSTSNFAMLFKDLDSGQETNGIGTFSSLVAAQTLSSGVVVPASIRYQVAATEVIISRKRPVVLVTVGNGGIEPFVLQEDWVVVPL